MYLPWDPKEARRWVRKHKLKGEVQVKRTTNDRSFIAACTPRALETMRRELATVEVPLPAGVKVKGRIVCGPRGR